MTDTKLTKTPANKPAPIAKDKKKIAKKAIIAQVKNALKRTASSIESKEPIAKKPKTSKKKVVEAVIESEANKDEDAEELNEDLLKEFKAELGENDDDDEVLDDDAAEESDDGVIVSFDNEEEALDQEEDEDDAAILAGIDSSEDEGENSSADEQEQDTAKQPTDEFKTNQQVISLDHETETKMKKKIKNTLSKKSKKYEVSGKPGVVYLGRIPHGFYEAQMLPYFKQFGDVNKLKLSRNRKTGASKHYAFIEFKHEEVAKIVADTMDGYLLYSHILKCKFIPSDKVHEKTFVGANKKFKPIPWRKIERERHNKPKTKEQVEKIVKRLSIKERKKIKALKAAGIDYEFPLMAKK